MKKEPSDYQKKVHTVQQPIHILFAKEYEDARDASYLNTFKLSKGFDKLAKLYFEYAICLSLSGVSLSNIMPGKDTTTLLAC